MLAGVINILASSLFSWFIRWQVLTFYFYDCGKVPPPVLMVQNVSFRYADDKVTSGLLLVKALFVQLL